MRRGFSLLELIVFIVITGLIFLAVPTIISQTSNNNTAGLIQQSIMDAKTRDISSSVKSASSGRCVLNSTVCPITASERRRTGPATHHHCLCLLSERPGRGPARSPAPFALGGAGRTGYCLSARALAAKRLEAARYLFHSGSLHGSL